jgi:hypothetical protein
VIIAYGDGDNLSTLRGTSPVMSSKFLRKLRQSACVVMVNVSVNRYSLVFC